MKTNLLIRSASRAPGMLNRVLSTRLRLGRTGGGLWFPDFDVHVPKHRNVQAVIASLEPIVVDGRDFGPGKLTVPGSNIVTDAGDLHYAQRAVSEALTNAFGVQVMGTAGTPGKTADYSAFTEHAASEKVHDATYPLRNDGDADNTGAGVDIVTFLTSWTKADFNVNSISHGVITNATPGATEALLTLYAFAAAFNKTANDTLKVFVNHEMLGV